MELHVVTFYGGFDWYYRADDARAAFDKREPVDEGQDYRDFVALGTWETDLTDPDAITLEIDSHLEEVESNAYSKKYLQRT